LETSSRQFADVVVATTTGRIDHQCAVQFEAALAPLVQQACNSKGVLVLDFAGVEYISSVGLRALMIAAKQLRAGGAKIAITNMQPVVAEIMAISRFDRLLGVFPSVRDAIELFSAAGLVAYDAAQPPPAG
jgi:anti-sigma B factor antagonist